MGLLALQDLRAITQRAIAGGLAVGRDPLFFGFSPAVAALVRSAVEPEAAGLKVEVGRLNDYTQRTADGYLLAIWLSNCADQFAAGHPDQQFFADWTAKVDALVPATPLEVATVSADLSGARAEAQSDRDVSLAMQQLEGSIESLGRRATTLMVSKRLHDGLHRVQVGVLPLWRLGISSFAEKPDLWRPIIQDRQRELRSEAQTMQGEYKMLAPTSDLYAQGKSTADDLISVVTKADQALAADDAAELRNALFEVRDTIRDDMRIYATRIESNLDGLDLGLLVTSLTRMADHAADPVLAAAARKAASALAAIMQDLALFGPQHRLWQDLDIQLWLLEEQFTFLSMGPAAAAGFNLQWLKIATAIDRLAGSPPADWFDGLSPLRDSFLTRCPVPFAVLPDKAASKDFDDFVLAVRRVFQTVDQHMKDICNLLREITVQLAQI